MQAQSDMEAALFEAYQAGDMAELARRVADAELSGTMRGLAAAALGEDVVNYQNALLIADRTCEGYGSEPSTFLAGEAISSQILVINEAHHLSHHRAGVMSMLRLLKRKGYTHFLFEGFVPERRVSELSVAFELPLAEAESLSSNSGADRFAQTGDYSPEITEYHQDPVLARLLRSARSEGFELVAFEQRIGQSARSRSAAMALNVESVLARSPEARLVVLTGHAHAREEVPSMAGLLKQSTGIDPVTLAQTVCAPRERGAPMLIHRNSVDPQRYDYVVSYRIEGSAASRWRSAVLGDEPMEAPTTFVGDLSTVGLGVLELRDDSQPQNFPVDRVLVRDGEPIRPVYAPAGIEPTIRLIRIRDMTD